MPSFNSKLTFRPLVLGEIPGDLLSDCGLLLGSAAAARAPAWGSVTAEIFLLLA